MEAAFDVLAELLFPGASLHPDRAKIAARTAVENSEDFMMVKTRFIKVREVRA
ncbi:MAG: hypothetical protein V4713_14305 [Pseudomonadota bacterium]